MTIAYSKRSSDRYSEHHTARAISKDTPNEMANEAADKRIAGDENVPKEKAGEVRLT